MEDDKRNQPLESGAPRDERPSDLQSLADSLFISPDTDSAPGEKDNTEDDETVAVTAESAQSVDNPEAEAEEETAEEEGEETEEDEAEDEEEAEPEGEDEADEELEESEEEDEDEAEEPVFTTPDGDEVTLDELKSGYLRQADYTRKTQQLAEMRKQGEQALQQVEQHNNTVAEHLSLALDVLEPQLAELASTNWHELSQNDPYEYAEKRAQFDFAQQRFQQLQEAARQRVAEQQHIKERKLMEFRAQEAEALKMAIPDLADPKKGPKLGRAIKDYAQEVVGLSEEEAGNILDHRIIMVLNKARQFDEMQSSTLQASRKKVRKAPKRVAKSGVPSSKSQSRATKTQATRENLRKSGSENALVDFLLS